MIKFSTLKKFDVSGMHKVYDKWPEISEKEYSINYEKINFSNIDHIVFAGMGGSGAIGDAFASILSQTKIHVSVVKGYLLPNIADSRTLVITISISGNTSETLAVLESAEKRKCKVIAISAGGKMEKYCEDKNIDFRKISQIHSPRASFVKFFYALLKILEPKLPISQDEVIESIKKMKELRDNISSENLSENNKAVELAKWISEIPLIYFPWGLNASAIRFKNSLQENSKIHAMSEDVIEASHNGIVAWENNSIIQPILLQGQDDHCKTKERWEILREFFKENNIKYFEIFSVKGNILSKIINLIYFCDYVSIYKAILSEIDPTPVKSIKFVKNKLNE